MDRDFILRTMPFVCLVFLATGLSLGWVARDFSGNIFIACGLALDAFNVTFIGIVLLDAVSTMKSRETSLPQIIFDDLGDHASLFEIPLAGLRGEWFAWAGGMIFLFCCSKTSFVLVVLGPVSAILSLSQICCGVFSRNCRRGLISRLLCGLLSSAMVLCAATTLLKVLEFLIPQVVCVLFLIVLLLEIFGLFIVMESMDELAKQSRKSDSGKNS